MNPHSKPVPRYRASPQQSWCQFVAEPRHGNRDRRAARPAWRTSISPARRPDDAANRNAMANPQALDAFARYASTQRDYRLDAGPGGSPAPAAGYSSE